MKAKSGPLEIFRVKGGKIDVGTSRYSCHVNLLKHVNKPALHFPFLLPEKEAALSISLPTNLCHSLVNQVGIAKPERSQAKKKGKWNNQGPRTTAAYTVGKALSQTL